LDEFSTADAGGVTTSPALTAPSVTRIVLVVSVATGFTTIVLAGPGPVAVSQLRAKVEGVALKRLAAGSLREQSAITIVLLRKMFERVTRVCGLRLRAYRQRMESFEKHLPVIIGA
jgi:hypothetical protein